MKHFFKIVLTLAVLGVTAAEARWNQDPGGGGGVCRVLTIDTAGYTDPTNGTGAGC